LGKQPNFIIIGAMKAGTTALFNYICGIPGVARPQRREIHYFDLNYHKGSGWYRAQFPSRYAHGGAAGGFTGESSPYYLLHPHVPARVAHELPDVRLIAMLRNPAERAYSHWAMLMRRGLERRSFESALNQEEVLLPREMRRLGDDPMHDSWVHRWFSYLSRGLYLDQLRAWHAHVPPERLLVVISEQLFDRPSAVVPEVTNFLGLPTDGGGAFTAANTGGYRSKMAAATRERLAEYFREPNERLSEYLGVDLGWDA